MSEIDESSSLRQSGFLFSGSDQYSNFFFMQQSEFFCIRTFPVTFLFFCKDMPIFIKFCVLKSRGFYENSSKKHYSACNQSNF